MNTDNEGVQILKTAVQRAESMVQSLETFLGVTKDRLQHLRGALKTVSTKIYFPRLSDGILAEIFMFASSRDAEGKPDHKTPCRLSRVSRRFRDLSLQIPSLWRFLDSQLHSVETMRLVTSRCTSAASTPMPMLEARLSCDREFERNPNAFDERVDAHVMYLHHIKPHAPQFVSLHFDYFLFYHQRILAFLSHSYRGLAFPSLQELRIDYADAEEEDEHSLVHFYRTWDLPSLKTLKATNFIPKLRLEVLAALTECSLSLSSGKHDGNIINIKWDLSEVMGFLGALSGVKNLCINLRGDHFLAEPDTLPEVSLASVEQLSTSFIDVDPVAAREFCRAFRTPSKSSWAVEIKDTSTWPLAKQLKAIFPVASDWGIDDPDFLRAFADAFKNKAPLSGPALKKVHLTVHRESRRSDCYEVMNTLPSYIAVRHGDSLESFSVTYPEDEQGFFGWKSPVRVNKVEIKNCERALEEVLSGLEERFAKESRIGCARLTIDGSNIEDSGIDELVLNAQIVRE